MDAGVHLSAIARILEKTSPASLGTDTGPPLPHTLTKGPFAGLSLPSASATANAAHVVRYLVDTYLVTHPHLDHMAGFVINTAGLPGPSRPKRLAALPGTIAAFKTHVFNNVIWPNLSDENNGAGLVTYMRLMEGGSPALGDGEGKGYLEMCDGLAVKAWAVSHGHCIERHSHRGSGASSRYGSIDASGAGSLVPGANGQSPRFLPVGAAGGVSGGSRVPSLVSGPSAASILGEALNSHVAGGSSSNTGGTIAGQQQPTTGNVRESVCVYDSSAYFIRDVATGREVLIFGDVEPDAISLSPRNLTIWREAAPRIVTGSLAAIFIECSYDDSQTDDRLFGHLAPRWVAAEMRALAAEVAAAEFEHKVMTASALKSTQSTVEKHRGMSTTSASAAATVKRKRKWEQPPPSAPTSAAGTGSLAQVIVDDGLGGTRRRRTGTNSGLGHVVNASSSPAESGSTPDGETTVAAGTASDAGPVSPKTVRPMQHQQSAAAAASSSTGASQSQRHMVVDDLPPSHHSTPHLSTPTAELTLREAEAGDLGLGDGALPLPPELSLSHSASAGKDDGTMANGSAARDNGESQHDRLPLHGLKVVIIHVKDRLADGPPAGDTILRQLLAYEEEQPTGVEYVISDVGQDFYF